MEAKYPETTLGEIPCNKIKQIFYPERAWDAKLADEIAVKFSNIKKMVKLSWPDKTVIEVLQWILKFDDDDYLDCST